MKSAANRIRKENRRLLKEIKWWAAGHKEINGEQAILRRDKEIIRYKLSQIDLIH